MFDKEECYLTPNAKAVSLYFISQGLDEDLAIEMALRVLGEAETFEV